MRWKIANNWVKKFDQLEQFSSIEFTAKDFGGAIDYVKNNLVGKYYPVDFIMKSEGIDRAVGHYFDPHGNHIMVILTSTELGVIL